MLYTLLELGLLPADREIDPQNGLAFDFLESLPGQPVLTGHADGIITINSAEANPSDRERMRELMHEGYRTLLGHFRHEIGHYFFDRLVTHTGFSEAFRELFGDERADYSAALQAHYETGPASDWAEHYVSTYASSHPWEDWAESWAHYMHMTDTLSTARACGVRLAPEHAAEPQLDTPHLLQEQIEFEPIVRDWFALTYVMNALNRSIGTADPYPFTLSRRVIDKLAFVHQVVTAHRTGRRV